MTDYESNDSELYLYWAGRTECFDVENVKQETTLRQQSEYQVETEGCYISFFGERDNGEE